METIALIIMLIALFLLYRIAYPKQPETKQGDVTPQKTDTDLSGVVKKSRFVRPDFGQTTPTPATPAKADFQEEKPYIFAAGNQGRKSAVISPDELDGVFTDEPNPEDLEIDDGDEGDSSDDRDDDIDLEAEDEDDGINRAGGVAEGVDFEDLQHVAQVVEEQPETVTGETGQKIVVLEHTDVFEKLVSGDEGKTNWIKAVIDRHYQNVFPETESNASGTDEGDMDIAGFLGLTVKK
jgi:hypothetical protein